MLQVLSSDRIFRRLLCSTANGSSPEPMYYKWGRPLRANVMPFQEDSGLEDVPNLLSNGNVALTPWTAQWIPFS